MLAPTSPVLAPAMTAPPINYDGLAVGAGATGQRQFKKHKVLPRPQKTPTYAFDYSPPRAPKLNLIIDSTSTASSSQPPSPRTLKHQSKRIGPGPDPPPTPPTHSRTSSSTHSALPSSPTLADQTFRTPKSTSTKPPTTPPEQRSPPTPDVTPPQPQGRPRAIRPSLGDRAPSSRIATTVGSRTDSFTTAREEPLSSEEDDGISTVRAALTSGRTSQTTVRRVSDTNKNGRPPNPQALNTALSRLNAAGDEPYTPRTQGEFGKFDGEWGSSSEVEREWDDNLNRTVTVRKRAPTRQPVEVIEDKVVAPTNATKAVRNMPLRSPVVTNGTPVTTSPSRSTEKSVGSSSPARSKSQVTAPKSVPSKPATKHSSAPVVETAIFVNHQLRKPQRQRTLRHVRKQSALRETIDYPTETAAEAPTHASTQAPTRKPARARVEIPARTSVEAPSKSSTKTAPRVSSEAPTRVPVEPTVEPSTRLSRTNVSVHSTADTASNGPAESLTELAPGMPNGSAHKEKPWRPSELSSRIESSRHDSYSSTMTVNSIASGKARRDVWKSGGVPVVVVPDRRSSKSSREPSLRSTSSRRSRRTMSLGSSPIDGPISGNAGPVFERPTRKSRAYSLSDKSERTIDFPPAIPARSSSLSAPTSRNTSRAGSLTADSLRAHDQLLQSTRQKTEPELTKPEHSGPELVEPRPPAPEKIEPKRMEARQAVPGKTESGQPEKTLAPPAPLSQATSTKSDREALLDHSDSHDGHDDFLSVRRYTARNTPFSMASIETNGTAPEVSEALAVHMYPHQMSSVMMVNHSAKPSDASEVSQVKVPQTPVEVPTIVQPSDNTDVPATPPQPPIPQFSLDDVESPLRNPRAPPEPPRQLPTQPPENPVEHPPALNFIPATPSGATPAHDKAVKMGNYFETIAEDPHRRPSLLKRALSRGRRHSVSYPPSSARGPRVILRSLSLTRRRPSNIAADGDGLPGYGRSNYPQEDDEPPEEHKLHPFWRPQWPHPGFDDDDEPDYHHRRSDDEGEYFKYPLVDNRPQRPKRTFSNKMKRTFAIMPIRDDDDYRVDDGNGPERRTIRRTSSGNLRVMRRRSSAESLKKRRSWIERPFTAPEGSSRRGLLRSSSLQVRATGELRRRFSLSGQLDGIQSIPRILSEKRREKRTQELRQKISGPREVRDGVEEVIRSGWGRENQDTRRQL